MTPNEVNDTAGIIALAAAVPAHLNVLIYGIGSPWWRSWLGRVLFAKWLSVALVFDVILLRRWLGEYVGYEWVAVVAYSFIFVAFTATTVELLIERRGPTPEVHITQRKALPMSDTPVTTETVPPIWYKAKRVIRTVLAVLIAIIIGIGSVLATMAVVAPQILDELAAVLPPEVYAWLAGAVAFIVTLAGVVTRIMAIPAVNAFLTKFGAGSVPAAALEGGGEVTPDVKAIAAASKTN